MTQKYFAEYNLILNINYTHFKFNEHLIIQNEKNVSNNLIVSHRMSVNCINI